MNPVGRRPVHLAAPQRKYRVLRGRWQRALAHHTDDEIEHERRACHRRALRGLDPSCTEIRSKRHLASVLAELHAIAALEPISGTA